MNVTNWIKKQVTTPADFGTKSAESEAIQKDLNDLAATVDELKQPVEVSLEGSYDNLSSGRKLALGAAGGAVVGGLLGATHGVLSPIGDSVELNVNWNTHPIMEQSLHVDSLRSQVEGMSSQVTSEGVIDVPVKGAVRYSFTPRILEEQVGEYQTPGDVSLERDASSNTTVSGLIGLGVGAGLGVVATAGMMAVKKLRAEEGALQTPSEPGDQTLVNKDEVKRMAAMSTLGAVAGAGVGALSGAMESARTSGLTQVVEWETPIMESRELGKLPQDATVLIRQDLDYGDNLQGSQIYRDPSEFDLERHMEKSGVETVTGTGPKTGLLGGIKMEEHSKEYSVEARTTMMTSMLGGAVVGGLTGLAAGVAYNSLKRMVEA